MDTDKIRDAAAVASIDPVMGRQMLLFTTAVAARLHIRDIRALSVLLVVADPGERSVACMPGVSVQHIAARIAESEEVVRHIAKNLQAEGLISCRRLSRTFLFEATENGRQQLAACLSSMSSAVPYLVSPST